MRVEASELFSYQSDVKLKTDLVDDAEADQYGQRKADADREKIDIDGQPVRDAGLCGAVCFWVCHDAPECFCFLFALPADLEWGQ